MRLRLIDGWTRQQGVPPTDDERQRLIDGWIEDEILFREGLARRLDAGDAQIRKRIASKMMFVLQAQLPVREPTEAELDAWFAAHAERWSQPVLIDFSHVFVADADERRATELLAQLQGGANPAGLGDTFSGGRKPVLSGGGQLRPSAPRPPSEPPPSEPSSSPAPPQPTSSAKATTIIHLLMRCRQSTARATGADHIVAHLPERARLLTPDCNRGFAVGCALRAPHADNHVSSLTNFAVAVRQD